MATVTLSPDPQKFPAGSAVSIYPRTDDTFRPGGAAQGNSPQTVAADGTVSFTGLTSGQGYWLADAQGEFEAVSADVTGDTPISETGDLDIDGDLTVTGGFGVNGASAQAKAAAITSPTAQGATYDQTKAESLRTAINQIKTVLANAGFTA